VLATTLHDAGDDSGGINDAAVAFARAIEVFKSIGNDAQLAKALLAYGRYKAECGELGAGKDMLRDAIMVFTKLGLARPASEAEKLLATLS
jgi:hypothetical protein